MLSKLVHRSVAAAASLRVNALRGFGTAAADPSTGLSFKLSDEQKEFQSLARKFAQEVMIPQAAEYDRTGKYPKEIFEKAWELGLCNGHIEEVKHQKL